MCLTLSSGDDKHLLRRKFIVNRETEVYTSSVFQMGAVTLKAERMCENKAILTVTIL